MTIKTLFSKSDKPHANRPFLLLCALFVLFLLGSNPALAGRCTGSENCTACTTCSSCEYCNSGAGTCGVCGSGTGDSGDSSGGFLEGISSNWMQWTAGIAVGGYLLTRLFKK
jgi:hypothetical protein